MYSVFNLIATWGGWSKPLPSEFSTGTDLVSIVTGGWVGIMVGLDRCAKSRVHWDFISQQSSPQRVAILITLSQSTLLVTNKCRS